MRAAHEARERPRKRSVTAVLELVYGVEDLAFENERAPGGDERGAFLLAPAAGVVNAPGGWKGYAADDADGRGYALFFNESAAGFTEAFFQRPFPAQETDRREDYVKEGLEHASKDITAARSLQPALKAGMRMWNEVPKPFTLSTLISPLCSRTIPRLMESPRPVPLPASFVVKNGSNTLQINYSGMPLPESFIMSRMNG